MRYNGEQTVLEVPENGMNTEKENKSLPGSSMERIGGGVEVCVTRQHTFGTDSFLLSRFAAPKKRETACDLCSGCGIIPLLWLREGDAPRTAHAVDIQPQAVRQMEISRDRSGLEDRFFPLEADLRGIREALPAGSMGLVTCNPPYKAQGTGLQSARESDLIARHEVLCSLDDVCRAAAWLLRFGGRLCVSQLPERMPDVMEAMRKHRIEPKRLRMVQQRPESAPWLILVEGRVGSGSFLTVEPPLILRNETGGPSPEMERIYGMYGKV